MLILRHDEDDLDVGSITGVLAEGGSLGLIEIRTMHVHA